MKFIISIIVLFIFTSSHAQHRYAALIDSGDIARKKMNYGEAISFYERAFTLAEEDKNATRMVDYLVFIGESYIVQNDMERALENYLKALKISESIVNDKNPKFLSLASISFYFFHFGNIEKAEEYLSQSKELILSCDLPDYSNRKYYNLLGVLEGKKKNSEASIQAYKKSLQFVPDSAGYDRLLGLHSISKAYNRAGDYEKGYLYLKKSEALNKSVQDDFWSMIIPFKMATYQSRKGNFEKALSLNLSALEKAEAGENRIFIEKINLQLSKNYAELRNFEKAYEHHSVFVAERQISHELENSKAIAEMEAKYEHEKKEQKIKTLEKEKTLKSQIHKKQIEQRNLWILLAVFVLIVTLIASILRMKSQRNKQRLKLELVEKQKEIAKQQSELKGQEKERNRLSRELHDGLGGTLASIKMRLSNENSESIQPVLKDIDAACVDVRNMSHSLSSTLIEETIFYTLLKRLCDDIQIRTALRVNLDFMSIEALNNLEAQRKHHSYRIVQELTNNIVKHAQATQITIGLLKNNNNVILLVEDNGTGFDIETKTSGIGLSNVQKRLKEMNGKLEIKSIMNQGTNFTISFPYISKT